MIKTLSSRIKELRKSLRLSQKEFGAKINLSQTHIASIETGHRIPTDRVCSDICREYNVNEDWLHNGIPPIHNDIISELNVADEVKNLTSQYCMLDDNDKLIIRDLIDSLYRKSLKN